MRPAIPPYRPVDSFGQVCTEWDETKRHGCCSKNALLSETRRKAAAGLGVLFVALVIVLAVVIPYRAILVEGPLVESTPLSLAAPIPGLQLHVFNTGANRMSSLLVGPDPPWRAAPAFIIEHPNHKLIAFDLGLSHDVAENGEEAIPPPVGWLMDSRGRVGLTLEDQMKEAGLSIKAVEHVVLSHLHGDHTGDAAKFERAAFYAGPGTRERMVEGSDSQFASGAEPEWHEVEFDAEGGTAAASLGPFDAAFDLLGDGSIYLIAAGGHTDEDIMALINLPSGPVLLTGDSVVHYDWLDSDDVERIASNPERAAVVRNQVRSLLDSGEALIVPGHDLRRLPSMRPDLILHHPERFKPSAWPIGTD
jgi:N-acyl homoserine lactone hydrolase